MNREIFARSGTVLGVAVVGAGLGLAGCSPSTSAGAAPAATHSAAASRDVNAAASTPAASPSAPTRSVPVAPATVSRASASSSSKGTGAATIPVLWNCGGKAVIEPSDYIVTCADAGVRLEGMHWSGWGRESAAGSGAVAENDCQPNCAEGKIIDYPAEVTLTGSKWWPREGRDSFTAITVHYPDAAPAVYSTVNGKTVVTHPHTFTWPPSGVPAQ